MDSKQIERFIKKVCPDIKISINFYRKAKNGICASAHIQDNSICFNRYYLERHFLEQNHSKAAIWLKGLILHEVGHIVNRHTGLVSRQELEAQIFAIETAEKLKMHRVRDFEIDELWSWGNSINTYSLAHLYQVYYDAYRSFLRRKKLVRKYGKIQSAILEDVRTPLPKKIPVHRST